MIADLKPYAEYKDSGLPWLGQVPRHWATKRGKAYLATIDERSETGREELLTVSSARGVVPRSSANVTMFKAESYAGHKLCWPGDLVINSLWAWGGGLGVSQHHGIISTAYSVYRCRPSAKINPQFLHALVRSSAFQWELQVRSKGVWISRLQLTDTAFLDAPIPLPPPDEQAAIVRFLDWANGRLERAIRAKRKVIGLLNEQKQAIIHRAVTRGLNPSVSLKPSGIPWLGDIPKHWEVRKVGTVADLIVSNVDKLSEASESAVRLCNYVDVYKNDKITKTLNFMHATATQDEIARFKIQIGDVIITKDSEEWDDIGVPSLVTYQAADLVCGYHLAILRPQSDLILGEFLHRVLEDRLVSTQMHVRAKGVTRYGLSQTAIRAVLLPLPPVMEQEQIALQLNSEIERFGAARSRLEDEIDLLREYRTRLVADVVTGKIDVREAAAWLPEEVPLDTVEDDADLGDDLDIAYEEATA
jgi:type I restriction enzyme S subunit